MTLQDRIIQLQNELEELIEDRLEEAYDEGYDDGHNDGYDEAYDEGYGYGHSDGRDEGYEEGYDEGHSDGYKEGTMMQRSITKEQKLQALRTALKDYEDFRDGKTTHPEEVFKAGLCMYFIHVQGLFTYSYEYSDIPELHEVPSDPTHNEYFYELGDIHARIDHLKRTINYIEENQ